MQDDVEAIFARRLKETREAAGLSQARLADLLARKAGITLDPTAITRIERSDRRIALSEAYGLAQALEVPLEYLCAPSVPSEVQRMEAELRKTRQELERAESAAVTASRKVTDLRSRADMLARTLQATAKFDTNGGRSRDGGFPAEAIRAAVALYGQAAVTDVTPKVFAHITDALPPDVADEALAAVAEVAREEQHGAVLRRIRHVGLERLAAEGIAAELKRRSADGVPSREISYFLDIVAAAWRGHAGWESARREFLDYLKQGGTSLLAAASLLVAKMAADSLPAFVPLRESNLTELLGSRDQGVRATRPQPVLTAAEPEAPSLASLDDLSFAADRTAAAIIAQTGKPFEVRERELTELQRVLRGTEETGSEGTASLDGFNR